MGILSRLERALFIDQGVERGNTMLRGLRPTGYTQKEWDNLAESLTYGNKKVGDKMKDESYEGRGFEHGGWATPEQESPIHTSRSSEFVHIPITAMDMQNGMIFHSHPGDMIDEVSGGVYPAALSAPDLGISQKVRGITSLDSDGGFGVAVRNPRAAMEPGEMEDVIYSSEKSARKFFPQSSDLSFHNLGGGRDGTSSRFRLARSQGVGRALKRANVLETFDYLPSSERHIAAMAELEPAIEAAAQTAEEKVRHYLKARGISDKDIAGIIATVGAGGLITMADELQNGAEL